MLRNFTGLLILALATFASMGAMAQVSAAPEQNVNPHANDHFRDAEWERWVAVFERDGREVYDRRHDILEALNIQPGATVADIGAGTGLFTRLFAGAVGPAGRVYAVDIAPNFVENIMRTAKAQGLDNVIGILNSQRDVMLPAASVDLAFIADTYHHFEYPLTTMASVHRALRPGGQLVVVDFKRIPGVSTPWVLGHVRAGKDTFIREIESVGFTLKEDKDFMETQYFLRFARE